MACNLRRACAVAALAFAASADCADSFDHAVKSAAAIREGGVPAVWLAPLDGVNVDILRVLSGGRILAGAYDLVPSSMARVGVPRYRSLAMHDASTGAVLWAFDRRPLNAARMWLVGAEPAVLLSFETQDGASLNLLALEARGGRKLWQADRFRILGIAQDLALGATTGLFGAQSLKALRLTDGSEAWSGSLPKGASVEIFGDAVYLVGNELAKHRLADGVRAWEAAPPGGVQPLAQFVRFGDLAVLTGADGAIALDDATGKPLWTLRGEGRPVSAAVADADLFLVCARDRGHTVLRLDGAGKVLWRAPLGGAVRSAVLIDAGTVIVASDTRLHALDRADGRVLWSSLVPAGIALEQSRAAWRIERSGNRIVLATPEVVAAFDAADGRRALHAVIPGARLPLPARSEFLVVGDLGDRLAKAGIRDRTAGEMYAESRVQQAQRTRDFVYSQTRDLRTADARLSRELASQRVYAERHAAMIQGQMDAAFGRAEAAANFANSIAGAINAMHAAQSRASLLESDHTHASASDQLADLLPDRFLLRPAEFFNRSGWHQAGYDATVIDLESGRRGDFLLSPWPHLTPGHSPRAVFDPATRRFVFAGMGTDPARMHSLPGREGRVPGAQLIAADADSLPLASADVSRHTLARPSAEYPLYGTSLLGLLMAADTEGLARLYANPKAQIPGFPARNQPVLNLSHGPRPLMVAAYEGNEALVNWLLANGSPVDQKDDRGWTASDYARWAGHSALAERLARTGSK